MGETIPKKCGTCRYWISDDKTIGFCECDDGEYFDEWTKPKDKCPDWKEAKHGRMDADEKGEA